MPSRYIYVELNEPAGEENVIQALRDAGMPARQAREVRRNVDGQIITELLAQGIWEHHSGQAHCRQNCPQDRRHRSWNELTEIQQEAFWKKLARFLETCRQDELSLSLLLRDAREFQETAVEWDAPDGRG